MSEIINMNTTLKTDLLCHKNNIRDRILVFNKFSISRLKSNELAKLSRHNKIVFDYICKQVPPSPPKYVDAFMASSIKQYHYMKSRNFNVFFVNHHADTRLRVSSQEINTELKYIGIPNNTKFNNIKMKQVSVGMDARDTKWMKEVKDPCIHYAIRNVRSYDGFKPATKIILASHTNSLIIAEEHMHDNDYYLSDYPFLVRKGDDIKDVINKTITSVKTKNDDFIKAVSIMNQIKQLSSHKVIADQFIELIESL